MKLHRLHSYKGSCQILHVMSPQSRLQPGTPGSCCICSTDRRSRRFDSSSSHLWSRGHMWLCHCKIPTSIFAVLAVYLALSLFPVIPRNDLCIWCTAQCLNNFPFAIIDGLCILPNAWNGDLSKIPLTVLIILSLNGTFLMAPTVLNQVRCEQNGYFLPSIFSLQSLGVVQHDWLHALNKSLSIGYNTISPH